MTERIDPRQQLEREVMKLRDNLEKLEFALKVLNTDLTAARMDLEIVESIFTDLKETYRGKSTTDYLNSILKDGYKVKE